MKTTAWTLWMLLLPLCAWAQQGNSVQFFLDICRFQETRGDAPYVEVYLAVAGQSLVFVRESDDRFQVKASVDLELQHLLPGDTVSIATRSYNLVLPDHQRPADTTLEQRRRINPFNMHTFSLPDSGQYCLQVTVTDSNAVYSSRSTAINTFFAGRLPDDDLMFSDIKWVAGELPQQPGDQLNRRDRLIPMATNSNFFNEDSLIFYQELYNTNKVFDGNFIVRCVVYQGDNRLWQTETRGQARTPGSINIYKEGIPIGELSSNIYYLQVELLNRSNRLVRTYRQRFYVYNANKDPEFDFLHAAANPAADMFNEYSEDQLDYYLQTLSYKATDQEQNFVRVLETFDQKKNYLYTFFDKRRKPDQQVEALWRGYLATLKYCNQEFKSAFREGWRTDRGRVFLKYGIPNDVERFPAEPNLIPYEVWRYNRLDAQTNVIFVFYDPDLSTDEYPLLHSTKYGELNNPRWRSMLTNRNKGHTPDELDYERNPVNGRFDPNLEIDD
ncbi:MAG: hypothetical protein OHK0039_48620 [Bacteroidia bacterium]